jgi:hypothetical protein
MGFIKEANAVNRVYTSNFWLLFTGLKLELGMYNSCDYVY